MTAAPFSLIQLRQLLGQGVQIVQAAGIVQHSGQFLELIILCDLDNLPKDVFEMLDFERIGRNIRISENGVFVERSMDHPGGYVARHALILEVAKTLDLLGV